MRHTSTWVAGLVVLLFTGCATFPGFNSGSSGENTEELARKVRQLEEKTEQLLAQQAEMAKQSSSSTGVGESTSSLGSSTEAISRPLVEQETIEEINQEVSESVEIASAALSPIATPELPGVSELPSNPQPGQCFAHVWREPVLQKQVKTIQVKEEETVVEVIPAQYQTIEETVLVQEAITRIEPVPAIYTTVAERVQVKAETKRWAIGTESDAPDATSEMLEEAVASNFDLQGNAVDGMCYHEHYYPATYESYIEQVLVKAAVERTEVIPAKYGDVDKQVLVEPEKEIRVPVPAVYRSVIKTIVDSPARSEWQHCGGNVDQPLNQVMCFVNIPATYKTVTQKVLESPATTKIETIPAKYKTVSVRSIIEPSREVKVTEPAQYAPVTKKRLVTEARYAWHEIRGGVESPRTRTGRKLCYNATPAEYRTINKQELVAPATTREVNIPARYEQVMVEKEVSPQRVIENVLPAQFQTVTVEKLIAAGRMEWRAIVCEADQTPDLVLKVQQALAARGYDLKKVDGKFGPETIRTLNQYQSDSQLPKDKYINIESLRSLGIATP